MATFTGTNGSEIIPNLILGPVQAIGNDFVDALGGDDIAIGWSGDDVIRGGAGADVIIGGLLNAAGVVTLSGVDSADYTNSAAGVTADLSVLVNLTLPILGINVQLTGATQGFGGDAQGDFMVGVVNLLGSNTGGDDLGGSAAANTLNGQGGNDMLEGAGGADLIIGGAGSDMARYGASGSAVTVNLATGANSGGDAAGDVLTGIENLFGSLFADSLTGDAGDNFLNDGGVNDSTGVGDTLTGGLGDDTYAVYNGSAVIVETAGQGIDRVAAGDDYVLADGVSIERLNTTSLRATYDVALTGNDLVQLVRGNDGVNVIDGRGGNDQLFGEGGADVFRFSSALGAGNVDLIGDFSVADDQIELDSAVFVGLDVGALDASAFKDNATSPKDADDRIYYNSDTGSLFFDVDGVGGASPIKFASLAPGLALSAADFTVI